MWQPCLETTFDFTFFPHFTKLHFIFIFPAAYPWVLPWWRGMEGEALMDWRRCCPSCLRLSSHSGFESLWNQEWNCPWQKASGPSTRTQRGWRPLVEIQGQRVGRLPQSRGGYRANLRHDRKQLLASQNDFFFFLIFSDQKWKQRARKRLGTEAAARTSEHPGPLRWPRKSRLAGGWNSGLPTVGGQDAPGPPEVIVSTQGKATWLQEIGLCSRNNGFLLSFPLWLFSLPMALNAPPWPCWQGHQAQFPLGCEHKIPGRRLQANPPGLFNTKDIHRRCPTYDGLTDFSGAKAKYIPQKPYFEFWTWSFPHWWPDPPPSALSYRSRSGQPRDCEGNSRRAHGPSVPGQHRQFCFWRSVQCSVHYMSCSHRITK